MKEKELCITLGISRDIIKGMRGEFTEGAHWKKIPSLKPENLWQIDWSEDGIALLRDRLGIKKEEIVTPPQKVSGTVSSKFRNPRVIGVLVNGKEESVLCRDSSKFGIGMPADVQWDGARWVVVRHPRFNGKY